ncbi:MAG: hypothetical protein U9Q79_05635, partial [Candidatus Hydrogenedentes bacterium]|nr:hypothetical protein [Candidatus Hydrogenedentota bacterium]
MGILSTNLFESPRQYLEQHLVVALWSTDVSNITKHGIDSLFTGDLGLRAREGSTCGFADPQVQ